MKVAKYIGIPFAPRGRGPDAFDCWGLVAYIYAVELGVELPAYVYEEEDQFDTIAAARNDGYWREVDEPSIWDVALFTAQGRPHVALCIDNQRMLHVPEGGTSCVEYINSPRWKSRINAFYRFYTHHRTH
jgi:cell wall-associated NlpC family hydrolase